MTYHFKYKANDVTIICAFLESEARKKEVEAARCAEATNKERLTKEARYLLYAEKCIRVMYDQQIELLKEINSI